MDARVDAGSGAAPAVPPGVQMVFPDVFQEAGEVLHAQQVALGRGWVRVRARGEVFG